MFVVLVGKLKEEPIKSRAIKIAFTLYFTLICVVFIMLRNSAPSSYEIDLYKYTPPLTWVFVGVNLLGGIGIIVHQALTDSKSRWWLAGFSMLLLNNFVLSALHILRGYYNLIGNDNNAHIGATLDILQKSRFGEFNIYPFLHVLAAQISSISNIPPRVVLQYIPAYVTMLYMIFMIPLASTFLKERRYVLLVAASTAPLIFGVFHWAFYTRGISHMLTPILFYMYFKISDRESPNLKPVFILFTISIPFMHPWILIIFLFLVVVVTVIRALYYWVNHGKDLITAPKISFTPGLIAGITFFIWVSHLWWPLARNVISFRDALIGEKVSSWLLRGQSMMYFSNQITRYSFYFKLYTAPILYTLISGLSILLVIKTLYRERKILRFIETISWVFITELFFIYTFLFVGASTIVEMNKLVLLSPLFVGFTLFKLSSKISLFDGYHRIVRVMLIFLIILIPSMFGILSLRRSPYVYQMNRHMTMSDFTATEWLFEHKYSWMAFNGIGFDYATPFLFLGEEAVDHTRLDTRIYCNRIAYSHYNLEDIPPHFGYQVFDTFGEQFTDDKYVVLTGRFLTGMANPVLRDEGRVVPVHHARWDFDETDFIKLQGDLTVCRIYSSTSGNSIEIYYVTGTKIRR